MFLITAELDKVKEFAIDCLKLPHVLKTRLQRRQWNQIEIDCIKVHWLPFEDVVTSAGVVGSVFDGEDQAIVLVLELVKHVVKDGSGIPYVEHFFHVDVDPWVLGSGLFDVAFLNEQSAQRDSLLDVGIGR